MSRTNKRLKLIVKNGQVSAIYDDALVPLINAGASVQTRRASHVEPDGKKWSADMSPVNGPTLSGFTTRQAALDAERDYINEHVVN